MGLRGYHVYRDEWRPYVHQPITFRKEEDNVHDNFAVAGCAKLPGRLIPGIVGRELSRHIWYDLEYGAIMNAEVKSERHRPSPLLQGGLEIPLTVTVEWENESSLKILSNRIESVGYHMDTPYADDSNSILKELGLEQD